MNMGHKNTLPFFFFNDTATTEIYTLSLHDALPIYLVGDMDRWNDAKTAEEAVRVKHGV